MKPRMIAIESIDWSPAETAREDYNEDAVESFADNIKSLPPAEVFHDGETYWGADGRHRAGAYLDKGKATIPCIVHEGGEHDAKLLAWSSNTTHGVPRSNPDKRKVVTQMLTDSECGKWSDRKIAQHAKVSYTLVSKVRSELVTDNIVSQPVAVVGVDGRETKPQRTTTPRVTTTPTAKPPESAPAQNSQNGSVSAGAVSSYFESKPDNGKPAKRTREPVARADADMPEAYVDDTGADVPESLFGVWQQIDEFSRLREACRVLSGEVRALSNTAAGRGIGEAANLIDQAAEEIRDAKPTRVDGKSFLTAGETDGSD